MNSEQVSVVSDWLSLESMREEWSALLQASRADCIFLTPEWILSWRYAMEGMAYFPYAIVVRDSAGELIGMGLYYLRTQRFAGIVSYRVLRTMGDFASGAAYHDILAAPGLERVVCKHVIGALRSSPADAVWISNVQVSNGARDDFREAARELDLHIEERIGEYYCIELPGSFEAYEHLLSSSTRKDLRRATRKLLLPDGSNLRVCTQESEREAMLETLITMNTRRWEKSSDGGVFHRKPREAQFYRSFTQQALQRGWLRFLQLDVDGKPAAMEIGYRYKDRYYALQGSYDLDGPPGTGKVVLMQMIKRTVEEHVKYFDLLSGEFDYKQRYGAGTTDVSAFFLIRKSLKTLPLRLFKIWPRGRFLDFYPRSPLLDCSSSPTSFSALNQLWKVVFRTSTASLSSNDGPSKKLPQNTDVQQKPMSA